MRISVSDGRTSPAETQQFAAGTFLELLILAIGVHPFAVVYIVDVFPEYVSYRAFETTAGHHAARGQNRHVAVRTVATVVDSIIIQSVGNLEQSLFIEEECPKVVFEIERSAAVFVLLELLPYMLQKVPVLQRFDVSALLEAGRTIPSASENIDMMRHYEIDNVGYLPDVRSRYGRHHSATDTRTADDCNFFDGRIERTGFSDSIVRFTHSVDRELVLVATAFFQTGAYLGKWQWHKPSPYG